MYTRVLLKRSPAFIRPTAGIRHGQQTELQLYNSKSRWFTSKVEDTEEATTTTTTNQDILKNIIEQVPDISTKNNDPFANKPTKEGEIKPESSTNPFGKSNTTPVSICDNWENINPRKLPINVIGKTHVGKVPKLKHSLDRVLFNPGVHYMKDPRTNVYNFDPYLEHITQPHQFDYDKLTPYITSSQDQDLLEKARKAKKKYVGSTSSMTHVLSHLYYLISHWKPTNISILSEPFVDMPTGFTKAMKFPASVFLRYDNGVYAIDADKSFDVQDSILMVLGKSMEKILQTSKPEYLQYLKKEAENEQDSGDVQVEKNEDNCGSSSGPKQDKEIYHYASYGKFVLRAQLDCRDNRLPLPIFDLKTRAVLAVRLDMDNYLESRGYQITKHHGMLQSFEREYYDMIRSAFLKYNFQARIGNMDGVFVTYHNTAKVFGFQYIPLSTMDSHIFGNSITGDQSFNGVIHLLGEILERFTNEFPEKTMRLTFDSKKGSKTVDVWVEVMPNEQELQAEEMNESTTTDTIPATNAETPETDAEEISQGDPEEGRDIDEEFYIPPGRTLKKFTLEAYSILNGNETQEPFVLSKKSDKWEIKWRMISHSNPDKDEGRRLEYQRLRRRQAKSLDRPLASSDDSEVDSYVKLLRRIARRGLKMNEPTYGRKNVVMPKSKIQIIDFTDNEKNLEKKQKKEIEQKEEKEDE